MVNDDADHDPMTLRLSIDAKAPVVIGPFARGGANRTGVVGMDHDFPTGKRITPFAVFVPQYNDIFFYMVKSLVTSDCIVDILHMWWDEAKNIYHNIKKIVINLDNGPENNSHRTQFIKRMVNFAATTGIHIQLAYYPPYHSKYNPVERCWGILERHWNGDILDSYSAVIAFARTMTWKGKPPTCVHVIDTLYQKGVKVAKEIMQQVEAKIERLKGLERWFVSIHPDTFKD